MAHSVQSQNQVPSAAQDNSDAQPSITNQEQSEVHRLVREIRAALPKLPSEIVAEVTNLLATVEGHLDASPPNPVATAEALALVRDQMVSRADSPVAAQYADKLTPVMARLGESV